VTSIIAEGACEPIKSGGKLEARLDLSCWLTCIYTMQCWVVELWTSQLVIVFKSHWIIKWRDGFIRKNVICIKHKFCSSRQRDFFQTNYV